MAELGINGKLILAQIINFCLLILIFKKFLYRPLLEMLEKRKNVQEETLSRSEEIEKRLGDLEKEQAEILNKAKKEAEKTLVQAKELALAQKDDILSEAKVKAKKEFDKMLAAVEAEIQKEREKLKKETVELARLMAEKILSKNG